MAKTRGTGVFMVWMDVAPAYEAEFNRWYNEEHLKHVLEVPGFLSGAQYVALKGGPKYLTMYELEDHNVVCTPAFLDDLRYKPSPWRTIASPERVGSNFLINVYRQIFPARTNPIELTMQMPRYVQMGRMDIPAHMAEEFNDWYNTAYIPGYFTVPGCIRARVDVRLARTHLALSVLRPG